MTDACAVLKAWFCIVKQKTIWPYCATSAIKCIIFI